MPRKSRDDQQEREMPPIPDGGLSSSMPEWLRRPPAWRSLPDQDVVQTGHESTGTLPEADTSEIDPRTFIHDDDLPAWLRSLRHTAPVSAGDTTVHQEGESPATVVQAETDEAVEAPPGASASQSFRPRRPPMPAIAPGAPPDKREITVRPDQGLEPQREQTRLTMLLSAALTVAIIVIIVLLVA